MSLSLLQKRSASTAADYKKTDTPQPDIKDDVEEEEKLEEEEAKDEELGMMSFIFFFCPSKCDIKDNTLPLGIFWTINFLKQT